MTALRKGSRPLLICALLAALAGCTKEDWLGTPETGAPRTPPPAPPAPRIVAVPQPIPMPGQLQPLEPNRPAPKPVTLAAAVDLANRQSLQALNSQGFINSMMIYD